MLDVISILKLLEIGEATDSALPKIIHTEFKLEINFQ